jgi:hypothetical protein
MPPQPAAPLRELAERGRLPDHQAMDQPTLTWIAEHRPAETARPALGTEAVSDRPVLLVPEEGWFTTRQAANGIHGVRHNARVCLLVGLLAQHHHLEQAQTTALCLAAAVHDCRRDNDRADLGHGQRATAWLARRHPTVTTAFSLDLTSEQVTAACTAISLHDVAYPGFSSAQQHAYQRATVLTDLLKAADCLDRYRLPLPRWWPDVSRLRIPVPAWLHRVAFDLMLRSEQAHLDGASHHDALTHASQTILT